MMELVDCGIRIPAEVGIGRREEKVIYETGGAIYPISPRRLFDLSEWALGLNRLPGPSMAAIDLMDGG